MSKSVSGAWSWEHRRAGLQGPPPQRSPVPGRRNRALAATDLGIDHVAASTRERDASRGAFPRACPRSRPRPPGAGPRVRALPIAGARVVRATGAVATVVVARAIAAARAARAVVAAAVAPQRVRLAEVAAQDGQRADHELHDGERAGSRRRRL